jgi:hypothetical protein
MTPGWPLKNEGRSVQGSSVKSGNHAQCRVIAFQHRFGLIEAHEKREKGLPSFKRQGNFASCSSHDLLLKFREVSITSSLERLRTDCAFA